MTVKTAYITKRRRRMKEIEFNLLTEPWIRVRLRDLSLIHI